MKDMKKLMGSSKKLSPIESKAKMSVLEKLKQDMQDMMGEKVSGLKKVTVASPDKEGLEKGLDKAKELLGHEQDPMVEEAEEEMGKDLDNDNEEGESEEHKEKVLGEDHESMSEEELDEKIQELLKQKELLKK